MTTFPTSLYVTILSTIRAYSIAIFQQWLVRDNYKLLSVDVKAETHGDWNTEARRDGELLTSTLRCSARSITLYLREVQRVTKLRCKVSNETAPLYSVVHFSIYVRGTSSKNTPLRHVEQHHFSSKRWESFLLCKVSQVANRDEKSHSGNVALSHLHHVLL